MMDVFSTMNVIGSALAAERTRINAIASNLANANTAIGVDGKGPYKRKDVILESVPMQSEFGEILDNVQHPFTEVRVVDIHEDDTPPRLVYKPEHPQANAEGYVALPNVDPIIETTNSIWAQRSYEADVNLFNTTKQMALKALEIGK